jgi:hypothetical protein
MADETSSPAKTIQTNINRNTKTFEKFSYFLGGIDVTDQNLDQFTPYIKGVSRFFVHKCPKFMNAMFNTETTAWKQYMETGYTSITGFGDVSVDFTDFEGGFAGQRFSTVSLARDDTESITVSVYELTGSPIREYMDLWVTGVRDPRSGIAHYHGAIATTDKSKYTPYSERNHTAEFIYVNLDPTGYVPEYTALFAHAFPTRVPKSHHEYNSGERDNAKLDLEFRVTKYESPAINAIGNWYIKNSAVNYNYLDFDPTINDTNAEHANLTWSTYDYGYGTNSNHTAENKDINKVTFDPSSPTTLIPASS